MHAIFFGLKRSFHGTLRIARTTFRRLGLTPARFDMLYALFGQSSGSRIFMRQSRLCRVLGVTRPTVSRMVRSLEELGLVRRSRSETDRRQLEVRLTPHGRSRIRFAHKLLTRSGWAKLAVDTALGADSHKTHRWCDEGYCLEEMDTLDGLLGRIRRAFGDVGTLDYPWNPDD
jgi:DNA-binding MarR family transcriptional regulator